MTYIYEPISREESEIKTFELLDPGIYDFKVYEAKSKISRSGNEMIELKLKIINENKQEIIILDYLLFSSNMSWKLRHFADAIGLTKEYEKKEFHERLCLNKCGKADIIIQHGSDRPNGGYYSDKNAVRDYVMTDKGALKYHSKEKVEKHDAFDTQEIPF